jgi:hypothetical protein
MKANAPENIYVHVKKGRTLNTWNSEWIGVNDIEYTRTDAFIEKAAKWLSNIPIEDMEYKYDEFNTSEGWYKMIEDFRNYMKGE